MTEEEASRKLSELIEKSKNLLAQTQEGNKLIENKIKEQEKQKPK